MSINRVKLVRAVTVSQSVGFYIPIVEDLKQKGYEIISVSSPGPELQEVRDLGIRAIEVPMERRISPFKDLLSLFMLVNVFRKEKPFMVHSMTPKAGMLCMLAAWLTRIPRRVHTFTGLVWPTSTGLVRKILMCTDWLTCACATHIIPEGKGVMNDLQQYITHKPMRVLGYGNVRGVDMQRFSRRPEILQKATTIRKKGIFTYLFVGRIVGDKGINELVEAFEKLHQKYTRTQLVLIGEYEANLDPLKQETVKRIDKNFAIRMVGAKRGEDLLTYYAAADCLVFPSYREGFPNVVLEAGAMGLPSIVTDINGSREIIENEKNGLIIPSKDSEALYTAMKRMLIDTDGFERMAAYARPMIESRFEQQFVSQCLYQFYDEIIKEKNNV